MESQSAKMTEGTRQGNGNKDQEERSRRSKAEARRARDDGRHQTQHAQIQLNRVDYHSVCPPSALCCVSSTRNRKNHK